MSHIKSRTTLALAFSQLAMAAILAGTATDALANDFSLVNNRFVIKNNSTTIADTTVGSDGILATTSLPQITLNNTTLAAGLPSFEFTLGTSGLLTNTVHTFKVGLSITDNADPTNRRFEAYIGELRLSVDGSGNVTGVIPSQDMSVAAKKGSATFNATISNPSQNGPATISGGTLTFNGTDAINRLKARNNATINALLDDFQLNGVFTFRIVVQETGRSGTGAQAARMGVTSGSTFTAVPRVSSSCPANTASQISSLFSLLTSTGLSSAYAVQGQFRAGTGGTANTLVAFTENCAVAGTGGGTTTPVVDSTALNQGSTAANQLNNAISSGSTQEATQALGNVSSSLNTIVQSVNSGATLTAAQQAQVLTTVESVFSNIDNLITTTSSSQTLTTVVNNLNSILQALTQANVPASATLVNRVVEAGQAASQAQLTQTYPNLSTDEIRQRLSTNNTELQQSIRSSLRIPPVTTPSASVINQRNVVSSTVSLRSSFVTPTVLTALLDSLKQAFADAIGVSASRIMSLNIVLPSAITTPSQRQILAATVEEPQILVDEVTGTTLFVLNNESYAGAISSVRAVSSLVPDGVSFLADGTAVLVRAGYAFELSASAFDIVSLAAAIKGSNYSTTVRSDVNALRVDLGSGNLLAGVFAYDNLTGKNLETGCGTLSINNPSGALNSAAYAFGINCSGNGVSQRLVPFVDYDNFFASLEAANLSYRVDRNTGFLTVTGVGTFKPDFFVTPLSSSDSVYHAANKDAQGTAFQATDVNRDGKVDFRIIAPNGVQVLFGV